METKDRFNKTTTPAGAADARASEKEEMLQNYLYWILKDGLRKKPSSSDACGNIPADKAYALPPSDHPPKSRKASLVFFAIVAALAVLIIIAYIPRYQRLNSPTLPQEVITNIPQTSGDSASSTAPTAPEPLPEAAEPPVAASEAMPQPSPVVDAAPKIKVIGNSDSLRYHLPGMKYYSAVKAYHRVEFDSEEAAIRAGYHKAPR